MSHSYGGNPVFPATITIPDDGDIDAAAAYAVAFEQLTDRTVALAGGGVGGSFTNATFHGVTTFADGSLAGNLTNPSTLNFGHFFHITVADNASLTSAMALALGGDSIEINAASTLDVFAFATSLSMGGGITTVNADNGITLNGGAGVTLNVNAGSGVSVTGNITSSYFDCFGGRFVVNAGPGSGSCEIALGSILIGDGASAAVSMPGTLAVGGAASMAAELTISAGGLTVSGGRVRLPTIVPAFSLGMSVDPNSCSEVILSNTMTSDTTVSFVHSFISIGHRVRFNAQLVTGAFTYYLQTGDGREWAMRNVSTAGFTVMVEFVSNGSQWVVTDWAAGGNAVRNGI